GSFFASVYDAHAGGNWEGVSILNRLDHLEPLPDDDEARLARARAVLLDRRSHRPRPATDDKILADWNGLAIAALATAGFAFDRPDWTELAAGAYRFVTTVMARDGRLAHSWRAGKAIFPGLATDHAAMTKAALALHTATQDPRYRDDAIVFS